MLFGELVQTPMRLELQLAVAAPNAPIFFYNPPPILSLTIPALDLGHNTAQLAPAAPLRRVCDTT